MQTLSFPDTFVAATWQISVNLLRQSVLFKAFLSFFLVGGGLPQGVGSMQCISVYCKKRAVYRAVFPKPFLMRMSLFPPFTLPLPLGRFLSRRVNSKASTFTSVFRPRKRKYVQIYGKCTLKHLKGYGQCLTT